MAERISGEGRVTVSLLRSMGSLGMGWKLEAGCWILVWTLILDARCTLRIIRYPANKF
jgi:hypothetical protein